MFSHVCVSVYLSTRREGGPHLTITHEELDLTVQAPSPTPSPISDIWPPPLALVPHQYWHLVVEAHTVGKRSVSILLECFIAWMHLFIKIDQVK